MRRSRSRGTRIFILIDRLIANENFSFLFFQSCVSFIIDKRMDN